MRTRSKFIAVFRLLLKFVDKMPNILFAKCFIARMLTWLTFYSFHSNCINLKERLRLVI